MRKRTMEELGRKSVEGFRESPKIPVIIVLDNIRSMHNVGSVFRTADAFLLEAIYCCGYTPRPPHRDIHKTALGATETVYWEGFDSTAAALEKLKGIGYSVWAVEQAAGSVSLENFTQKNSTQKTAFIFGNEVSGVESSLLNFCDGCIEIPQMGMKHSLNISVAAGIVLWEWVRSLLKAELPRAIES